jgi:hypothetical protein
MSAQEPASKPGCAFFCLCVCFYTHLCALLLRRAARLRCSCRPAPCPRSLRCIEPPRRPAPAALTLCGGCLRRANTDPVLYYQTQDKWIREYWVHVEYMKLLKDEVRNCYRREGVNHYENCRDLVHEYYARTKAPMFSLKGPK